MAWGGGQQMRFGIGAIFTQKADVNNILYEEGRKNLGG